MTNEDKLREIFPKTIFVQHKESDKITMLVCSDEWLNAEYKEPQIFKWCTDCREYDQEKHCCHRWSKVIRDTVEEMKQEPILDKIRIEIEELYSYVEFDEDLKTSFNMVRLEEVQRVLDKYKAETEGKE